MAVKYVKDFVFGPMTSVQHYAKGGHVTKVPAKAKPAAKGMPARAKPNAPAKGAKRMESPPKVGKGQGYKDGGKVPGKQMDRLPTKTPPGRQKDLAPAKPEKGQYQGYNKGGKARRYAEGGDVQDPRFASIEPGAGSPLDAGVRYNQYGEADPFEGRGARYESYTMTNGRQPVFDERGLDGPANSLNLREPMPLEPMPGEAQYEGTPTLATYMSNQDRYRNHEPESFIWSDGSRHYQPEPEPYNLPPPNQFSAGPEAEKAFLDESIRRDRERMLGDSAQQMRDLAAIQAREQAAMNPMDRAVREAGPGRAIGLSDLMRAARNPLRSVGLPNMNDLIGEYGMPQSQERGQTLTPYMPTYNPTTKEESDAYMRSIGGTPSPMARFAKGGKVGQSKVGKVMGEYKKGELHSGSKKGPLVKNPKQAVAIALSEARKAGAKIPKKAEGGSLSDKELGGKSYAGRNEPLRGRYVSREEKIMREAVAKEKQKDMERKMREAYERTQSQSVSGLKKGGMARKAVPTHKGKAMYGGGKC